MNINGDDRPAYDAANLIREARDRLKEWTQPYACDTVPQIPGWRVLLRAAALRDGSVEAMVWLLSALAEVIHDAANPKYQNPACMSYMPVTVEDFLPLARGFTDAEVTRFLGLPDE